MIRSISFALHLKKVAKLANVIDEEKREEANYMRENLFLRCRQAIYHMEDYVAGFALAASATNFALIQRTSGGF